MTTITDVWTFRGLVGNFAQRELKAKYKGSALGWFWSLLNPVATIAIYTVVFSTIFRASPPIAGNGHLRNYTVYLFAGLICWNFFFGVVTGGMGALIGAGPLLKKIYFPPFAPIVGSAVSVLVQAGIETVVLAVVLTALGNASWTFLLVPPLIGLLAVFALGLGLVFALLNVYFRDVGYIVGIVLQLLFYATPIIYPPEQIPAHAHGLPLRSLFGLNPLAQFVDAYRDLVYQLRLPGLVQTVGLLAVTAGTFALGWLVFRRGSPDVGEEL